MYSISKRQICQFSHEGLQYRIYLFDDGEIAFTVYGNAERLGLVSQEDLRWSWDWVASFPVEQETSQLVNTHVRPLRALRTIAQHLARYLQKHRPNFFYYRVLNDPRQARIYDTLARRHADVAALYERVWDGDGGMAVFSLVAEPQANPAGAVGPGAAG